VAAEIDDGNGCRSVPAAGMTIRGGTRMARSIEKRME